MLPGDPTVSVLLALILVCVVAYFLKGFSGFGPAVVLVPTVTLVLGPDIALANSAVIDLVVGTGLAGIDLWVELLAVLPDTGTVRLLAGLGTGVPVTAVLYGWARRQND